jgi:hypothetical protein
MHIHLLGPGDTSAAAAVSSDGESWLLVNANAEAARHWRGQAPPHSVVLLDARLQSVAGLPALLAQGDLAVYATPLVFETLTASAPLVEALDAEGTVRWQVLPVAGDAPSVAFVVPALPDLRLHAISTSRDDDGVGASIALQIEDARSGRRITLEPVRDGLRVAP